MNHKRVLVSVQAVCHERGFIFVHIPKNAGTSLAKALGFRHTTHHTAREIQEALKGEFEKFFKFCFVRNPWDRFLSLYRYARMEESYYHSAARPEKALCGKHLDYDLLKDASLRECAHLLIEGRLRHDHAWNHWRPQTEWILNEEENPLVDFMGWVERMDESLAYLSERLRMNLKVGFENQSAPGDRKSYRDSYDAETKKIVEKYYEKDIEYFGYEY